VLRAAGLNAGSCSGCEVVIVNRNRPVYDLARFSQEHYRRRGSCLIWLVTSSSVAADSEGRLVVLAVAEAAGQLRGEGGWLASSKHRETESSRAWAV
jgi:hypothetical protein